MENCDHHIVAFNEVGQIFCPTCQMTMTSDEAREVLKEIFVEEENAEKILHILTSTARYFRNKTQMSQEERDSLLNSFHV